LKSPENYLIARLPHSYRLSFLKLCESVPLILAEVLAEGKKPPRYVYFPITGFISTIAMMEGEPVLEVGMVGREGMLGANLALGASIAEPMYSIVQGSGRAWRMRAVAFKHQLARNKALRRDVHLYLQVAMAQLTTAAACQRFHQIGPRLARWLLLSQDRTYADSFRITHEFLSFMLGMRRAGITTAASALQRKGLIKYRRGQVTVLDRRGLERIACSCYAADQRVYARLLH
jgi:CRP-like cAMP-binding protein